jgi:hypothetical protein
VDTVKSVVYRHSHQWLCITDNCVLEEGRTQLAISSEYITAVTTSRRAASTTTQSIRVKRVGWLDHGKNHKMFRSHAQTDQSFYYKMMVKSAFSWKVSETWKSKSKAESVMIPSSSL